MCVDSLGFGDTDCNVAAKALVSLSMDLMETVFKSPGVSIALDASSKDHLFFNGCYKNVNDLQKQFSSVAKSPSSGVLAKLDGFLSAACQTLQ